MIFKKTILTIALLSLSFASFSSAHPGKTDSKGGHTCWTNCAKWGLKDGEYHYHKGGFFIGEIPTNKPTPSTSDVEEVIPAGHVKVTLPSFKVYINYKTGASDAQNSTLKYPLFLYNDIIYAPLNYDMCSTLTIENNWSSEVGLSLKKLTQRLGRVCVSNALRDPLLSLQTCMHTFQHSIFLSMMYGWIMGMKNIHF